MALTKTDIVERISEALDLSGAEAKDTVEEMLEIVKSTLGKRSIDPTLYRCSTT